MTTTAIVIAAAVLLMALIQAFFGVGFARLLHTYRPQEVAADKLPYASILLSLRGADPFLAKGLRRLMSQDYPRYDLRIVVDRDGDPSQRVVEEAIAETGFQNVRLSAIQTRSDRCSLKCSALVQLARELDQQTEVVVLADADLVSHDGWLRELTAPLLDERIGATHGNRWFWPQQEKWGSLVRFLWNVAAVAPMQMFQIPWGGTFAIRASILRETGLLDKWSRAVVEDAPVRSAIEQLGLRIQFVPSLMMINREDCTLPFSLDFIKRQLTWTKIYHPRWAPVVLHAVLTLGVHVMGGAIVVAGLVVGDNQAAALAGVAMAAYLATMFGLIWLLDANVRQVIARRDEPTWRFSLVAWIRFVVAIPLTQIVYTIAVLMAMFRKRVTWRGVTYLVRGPWDIQLLNDQPYDQPTQPTESNLSL